MSKINESFYENKTFDMKELPIVYFSNKMDTEQINKDYIKNTIRQCEDDMSKLSILFFSAENIDLLNKELVLRVYKESKNKYKISFQDPNKFLTVMRYIWIQYSKNLDFDYKNQIKELNCKVITEILPGVLTNIDQYYGYLKDYQESQESKFKLNDLPVSTKMTRGTIELPSISDKVQFQ